MVKQIKDATGNLLAILLEHDENEEYRTEFCTGDAYPLQLGVHYQPEGHRIPPHAHTHVTREVQDTAEVLVVTHGFLECVLYDDDRKKAYSTVLLAGEAILLVSGGHEFVFGKDTRVVEVKQGPYVGRDDKEWW